MSRARDERGTILVLVGLALIVLLAFSAFVIDYGVLWVSRGQAQNAADAAANAAAVGRAYGDFGDKSDTGPAKRNALSVAATHRVWGQAPTVTAADVTFPLCPDDNSDACVRVDVYRNALPTFFARLVGVTTQSVKATATAKAGYGNAVDCIKPFAVADKWFEHNPVDADWAADSTYYKYDKFGNLLPVGPYDEYVPPTPTTLGSGFHPFELNGDRSDDYGRPFTLKMGSPSDPDQISSGWFMPLALPGSVGGADYEWNITNCYATPTLIGGSVSTETEPGNMIGPTKHGINALIAKDPGASWDEPSGTVVGSAFVVSPRIVPIPLISVEEYYVNAKSGRTDVTIVNILGFFVKQMNGNDVEGYLCAIPGKNVSNVSGGVGNGSSFLRTVQLVR